MKYRIVHETRYSSAEPISVGHNEAWLTPRTTGTQRCLDHHLEIEPTPSMFSSRVDYFGNLMSQFVFNQGYHTMSVKSVSEVELSPAPDLDETGPAWEEVRESVLAHQTPEDLEAYEYCFESPRCRLTPEFGEYCRESFPPGRPIVEGLRDLMERFFEDFENDPNATNVSTPVDQVFRQRRGVCQDFAHMMISMVRSWGLAARYVSGYLRTYPPPGKPRLVGADASHAWLSVYCGPLGWVDLDPTNNLLPNLEHVTIGWGRDYGDVAPVKGVYIGGSSPRLSVSVDMAVVEE